MAVTDGVASIRLEGDEKRALALIPEAKALLYKVQTLKKNADVNTFSMTRRVNDDASIYVLSAHGQNIIHISVSPDTPEQLNEEEEGTHFAGVPDFYSGLVYGGKLSSREGPYVNGRQPSFAVCETFSPTASCAAAHEELSTGRQAVRRLAIEPWTAFPDLRGRNGESLTQYAKLRPSMYSGTMKKVVQVVMGLGRIGKEKMRDPRRKVQDSEYIKDVDTSGVQVRYDWRFTRTHGITRATDGRLWLVEISITRGVIARPLPMFPGSNTEAFLRAAENRNDGAMVKVLEELGGLPTGEAFPGTAQRIAQMIEDGDIIRLAEPEMLRDFYQCSAYSSYMGWAFSPNGVEAHNTAYYYSDSGFQRGVWYQINISIGASQTNRHAGEPIATGSANIRKQAEGFIYCPPGPPRSRVRFAPFKAYEPMLPGLLSHDGAPDRRARGAPPPLVDTTMFVCFVNGELKAVKYYRNPDQGAYSNITDDLARVECPVNGAWTRTSVSGLRSFPPMMYTNNFDDRKVTQENTSIITTTSKGVGYDPPNFSDFLDAPTGQFVWRERVWEQITETDNRGGEQLGSVVVVPQYSREAYYYASASRYNLGRSGSTSMGHTYIRDPNVGYGWRCFVRILLPPYPPNRPDCNSKICRGEGKCNEFGGVGVHKERRIICVAHEGSYPCSEFADGGQWLGICQIIDKFNTARRARPTYSRSWNLGKDEKTSLYLVSDGYNGPLELEFTADSFFEVWMTPSPNPDTGAIQQMAAEHSALGEEALIYDANLGGPVETIGYTPSPVLRGDGFPTFIGVNAP